MSGSNITSDCVLPAALRPVRRRVRQHRSARKRMFSGVPLDHVTMVP
jgi:hypothetical protein